MSLTSSSARPATSRVAGVDPAAGSPLGFGDGLEVVGELGRGAHAAVYRVRRDGVDYALKALHHRADDAAGRSLLEFRREAALLALLDHPGVPKVFDVGQADGRPYLVMELLDGGSLADLLERASTRPWAGWPSTSGRQPSRPRNCPAGWQPPNKRSGNCAVRPTQISCGHTTRWPRPACSSSVGTTTRRGRC